MARLPRVARWRAQPWAEGGKTPSAFDHQTTVITPLNPNFKDAVRDSFAQQQIMNLIGAELGAIEPGIVEIRFSFRPELTQQNGYIHAGVLTTVADSACGYAAFSLMPAGASVLSVEFKVNLLRPARGQAFRARAEVIKAGRTITVVRADVFGEDDDKRELVATMQGTMMCLMPAADRVGDEVGTIA